MRLRELCERIVADVDGCLGCAVVDLTTGLPLAMNVVPGTLLSPAAMEVMSAASVDYFRGRTVWQLELAMTEGAAEAESAAGFVREIQTTTEETYHFMSVVPGREDTLLILITDKTANLGLGWIAMRQALARIGDVDAGDLPGNSAPAPAQPPIGWQQTAAAPHAAAAAPPHTAAPVYLRPVAGDAAPLADARYSTGHADMQRPEATGQPGAGGQEPFNPRWRGGRGVRGRSSPH